MDKMEIKARLEFRKAAIAKLRAAYLALVEGGVKSYALDDRQLTRFDLPDLKAEIEDMESEIDSLESQLSGKRFRKAFGVIPRDW